MRDSDGGFQDKGFVGNRVKAKSLGLLLFIVAYFVTYLIVRDLRVYEVLSSWDKAFYRFSYWLGFAFFLAVSLVNIMQYIKMHKEKSLDSVKKFKILFTVTAIAVFFVFTYHFSWLVKAYAFNSDSSLKEYINELHHIILPTFIPAIILLLATTIYILHSCKSLTTAQFQYL